MVETMGESIYPDISQGLAHKMYISPHLVSIITAPSAQTAQDRLLVPRILAVLDFQQKNKPPPPPPLGNKKPPST